WCPAMNVPSSRLSGNCTTKLSSVISSVSHMALSVTGPWNTWNQASRPANCGVPSPSHAKNDSTTTPASGSRAKTPKKLSAGASSSCSARCAGDAARPPGRRRPGALPRATDQRSCGQRRVHVRDELVGLDLPEEDPREVVQQLLRGGRGESLVPGQREVRGAEHHV